MNFGYFRPFPKMTAHELNIGLQVGCITLLTLAGIFLFRHSRNAVNSWTGISLVASVICYLILEASFIQQNRVLFLIAVSGAICIPVIFFLLTKAIFDDHFKPTALVAIWFLLEVVAHYWIYLDDLVVIPRWAQQLS